MKKEQLLLVACAVIAALFFWMNLGLYEDVNASELATGTDVPTAPPVEYDLSAGLEAPPGGRSLFQPQIREVRGELPELAPPAALDPTWIRPLMDPPAPAAAWSELRTPLTIARPADTGDETGNEDGEDGADGEDVDFDENPFETGPERDMTKVARLVRKDGSGEIAVLVEPRGALKDQPEWRILELWPNAEFMVTELNEGGTRRGTWVGDASSLARYSRFVPTRNCENEYHEERIRRAVRDTDRGGLMELAQWCLDTLSKTYGTEAVKKAVTTLEQAYAVKADAAIARQLASAYSAAYDPEGEVRTLLRYLDKESRDVAVMRDAADALDRVGMGGTARGLWEEAAKGGDLGAYLGLGWNKLANGELDAALTEFKRVQSGSDRAQLASAFAGTCDAQIRLGDFKAAVAAAKSAAQYTSTDQDVLARAGAAYYYAGDFTTAESVLRKAAAVAPNHESRARSNLGFVLLAKGDLAGARAAFEQCLADDPLNFVDPHVGLGCVNQREGDPAAANDSFAAALRADTENAWIRMRTATMKQQDGVPKDALMLARETLQRAPGSIEALRTAGVAADDMGDGDTAVEYLGRAVDKAPDSAEVIYEFGRALANADRGSQSVAFLAQATNVTAGPARRDGNCLILYAYALYKNRSGLDSVLDAIQRANRAAQSPASGAYLKEMRTKIADWDATRIWTDNFNRQADEKLYNGWIEDDDRLGPAIRGDGTSAIFRGTMRAVADPRQGTSMSRPGDLKGFMEAEVSFRRGSDTEVVIGISIGALSPPPGTEDPGKRRGGRNVGHELALAVDRDSKVWIWATTKTGRGSTVGLKRFAVLGADGDQVTYPEGTDWHTCRFARTGPSDKAGFEVSFDGGLVSAKLEDEGAEPVSAFEISGLAAKSGREYTLSVIVDADRGTDVDVRIDDVTLTRKIN